MTHAEHQAALILANLYSQIEPKIHDADHFAASRKLVDDFLSLAAAQKFPTSQGQNEQYAIVFNTKRVTFEVETAGDIKVNLLIAGTVLSEKVDLQFDPIKKTLYSLVPDPSIVPNQGQTLPPLVVLAKATQAILEKPRP